jgi:hypothetical protein
MLNAVLDNMSVGLSARLEEEYGIFSSPKGWSWLANAQAQLRTNQIRAHAQHA